MDIAMYWVRVLEIAECVSVLVLLIIILEKSAGSSKQNPPRFLFLLPALLIGTTILTFLFLTLFLVYPVSVSFADARPYQSREDAVHYGSAPITRSEEEGNMIEVGILAFIPCMAIAFACVMLTFYVTGVPLFSLIFLFCLIFSGKKLANKFSPEELFA